MRFRLLLLVPWACSCFDFNGAPYGGPGEPCWPKGSVLCDDGLTCAADGICRSVPPDTRPTCTVSLDCPDETACENGRCSTYIAACGGDDANCRPDYYCATQLCAKRQLNGAPCVRDFECVSGVCSDGVCCDRVCNQACESCRLTDNAIADGTCGFIPGGTDPQNECANVISCDGQGGCAYKDLGSTCDAGYECASGACADGVCCDDLCDGPCERCDAAGACKPVLNLEDPGRCDDANSADNCIAPPCACDSVGDCKVGGGASCQTAANCANGQSCVDGVCCDSPCAGACQACVASKNGGSTGHCGPIPAGADPDNECDGTTACAGNSSCFSTPLGSTCTYSYECVSDYCSIEDRVCCNQDCQGQCVVCADSGASKGQCLPVAPSTPCSWYVCQRYPTCGPGDQDYGGSCSADGRCLLPSNTPCNFNQQCASGFCDYYPIISKCR